MECCNIQRAHDAQMCFVTTVHIIFCFLPMAALCASTFVAQARGVFLSSCSCFFFHFLFASYICFRLFFHIFNRSLVDCDFDVGTHQKWGPQEETNYASVAYFAFVPKMVLNKPTKRKVAVCYLGVVFLLSFVFVYDELYSLYVPI